MCCPYIDVITVDHLPSSDLHWSLPANLPKSFAWWDLTCSLPAGELRHHLQVQKRTKPDRTTAATEVKLWLQWHVSIGYPAVTHHEGMNFVFLKIEPGHP